MACSSQFVQMMIRYNWHLVIGLRCLIISYFSLWLVYSVFFFTPVKLRTNKLPDARGAYLRAIKVFEKTRVSFNSCEYYRLARNRTHQPGPVDKSVLQTSELLRIPELPFLQNYRSPCIEQPDVELRVRWDIMKVF